MGQSPFTLSKMSSMFGRQKDKEKKKDKEKDNSAELLKLRRAVKVDSPPQ